MEIKTIEKLYRKNKAELMKNTYEEMTDNRLKEFKLTINHQFDPEMDFGIKTGRKYYWEKQADKCRI